MKAKLRFGTKHKGFLSSFIAVLLAILLSLQIVYAGSRSYSSTYDIKHQVFSDDQYMSSAGTMKAKITPKKGKQVTVVPQVANGATFTDYGLGKKVYTTAKTVSFSIKSKGSYRFCIRKTGNWEGRAKGNCTFWWKW